MPLSALLLLILSALLHAAYYGFYKRSADKQVFAWWFLLVAVVIYSPALILNRSAIPAQGWLWLLLSSLADVSYVGYAGSVRSVNVIFGALLGALLLKEPYGAIRVLASSLVFGGVLLIGVAG